MSASLGLDHVNWADFDSAVERAVRNKLIADVMRTADDFLHSIFESGDEPKWTHESQRSALLELRKALIPLGDSVCILDAVELHKIDALKGRAA